MAGLALPTRQVLIRARGRPVGNGSSSDLVESVRLFWLPPPPPKLEKPAKLDPGPFQFYFQNPDDVRFTVLTVADPTLPTAQWEALDDIPVAMSSGLYEFTDSTATNAPKRLYQLQAP